MPLARLARHALIATAAIAGATAVTVTGQGAGASAARDAVHAPAPPQAPAALSPVLLVNGPRLMFASSPDGRCLIPGWPTGGDSQLPACCRSATLKRLGSGPLFGDGGTSAGVTSTFCPAPRLTRPPSRTRAPVITPGVHRDYPVHTLTVDATDLSGKPDSGGLAWIFDADNLAAFGTGFGEIGTFHQGVAKFSVPAGHYWAIAEFDVLGATRAVTRVDLLPEFTVDRNTTVDMAEAGANSKIAASTPRPAVPQDVTFTAFIGDRLGSSVSVEWFNSLGPIWVSPTTRKPVVGSFQSYTSEQLASPAGTPGTRYAYNLDYAGPPGLVPAQDYRARPSNLATVTERYYQDTRSTADWTTFGAFPGQALMGFNLYPLSLPGTQIQYFSTAPTLLWSSGYDAFPMPNVPTDGQDDDTFRVLGPGQHLVVDWNGYPLHPQPDFSAGALGGRLVPLAPAATRSGNTLMLATTPFSDNQPGHLSAGSAAGTRVAESYEIDQNGVPIASGNPAEGIAPVTLRSQPSVIRFTLDAARTGTLYRLSARTHTVWTWRSRRQPAATVPTSWYCSYSSSGQPLRTCAVQPMMTLDYRVHGLALDGTVPPGQQLIGLRAGHIQLASAARITGATAQVSCDGGKSWQPAAVRPLGGGTFRAAFTAPAGCVVTLRVTAADAAGDSIAETVYSAYRLRRLWPARRSGRVRVAATTVRDSHPAAPPLSRACLAGTRKIGAARATLKRQAPDSQS